MAAIAEAKVYKNVIGGSWVSSESGDTPAITNPARKGTVVGRFQSSAKEDAGSAVSAAAKASAQRAGEVHLVSRIVSSLHDSRRLLRLAGGSTGSPRTGRQPFRSACPTYLH